MKFKIEQRQELWKKRIYKTVVKDEHFKIERPVEFNLEDSLKFLLRRKQKWE